jgi:demethylmenaquinone methyltransferase/2-methoxy-6-polyprenyl-1,4-benzoquinol methylase
MRWRRRGPGAAGGRDAPAPVADPGSGSGTSGASDAIRAGATLDAPGMATMFDAIVPVYDRLNTVMTLGTDDRWRRRAVRETRLSTGGSALDVACGTGKLAALLADAVGPFGRVEGIDLSPAMVAHAATALHALVQVHVQVGNAMELPFDDGSFEAATIAFGLRNLPDFAGGIREMARVVRPGGRVVCLELSLPRQRHWRRIYHALFRRSAPLAARIIGGSRDAYRYLPSSLDGFPDPSRLAAVFRDAGLTDVTVVSLATGIASIHAGTVPASARPDGPSSTSAPWRIGRPEA